MKCGLVLQLFLLLLFLQGGMLIILQTVSIEMLGLFKHMLS